MKAKIGILAIQGDVVEHINSIKSAGATPVEVRLPEDLKEISGLIIPGGESTTLIKLMKRFKTDKEIIRLYKKNKLCIYGTCAGAILIAKNIINYPKQESLNLLDISIQRNGYGRQLDSFEKKLKILNKDFNCIFIRAPKITRTGKDVKVIKKLNTPVMIKQDRILVTTFHPELTDDPYIHKHFIDMCIENKKKQNSDSF
jgi:5'-phosphate synthase pdxT subunit